MLSANFDKRFRRFRASSLANFLSPRESANPFDLPSLDELSAGQLAGANKFAPETFTHRYLLNKFWPEGAAGAPSCFSSDDREPPVKRCRASVAR
jgi:hypothetical protein